MVKKKIFFVNIYLVSAFTILTGHTPFEGEKESITYENIKNCDYHFPSSISISPLAKDFIQTIFQVDPEIRPTTIDISSHKFMIKVTIFKYIFYDN